MHPFLCVSAAGAAAVLFVVAVAPAQTTVTLPCVQDNTLYESPTGALSNGAGEALFVGVTGQTSNARRRALLRFDIAAAIPAGAFIVSARLGVTTIQSSFPGNIVVTGHRVTRAWGEGTSIAPGGGGSGGAATTGDATWIHSVLPGALWTNPGGDYVASASLRFSTQPLGPTASATTAAAIADVQRWLDNPATNFGWLLRTNEGGSGMTRKIDSRETTTGTPPSLTVSYLLPSQTGQYGATCPTGITSLSYRITAPAIGGGVGAFVQSNGPPGQLAANLISLEFDADGLLLFPTCPFYLTLGPTLVSHSIVVLGATGGASVPAAFPAGFPGLRLFAQSAVLASASPSGYVLSNAAIAVIQ
ncbi:MAG: DNRLRE domain-containing protein [Planctomycetes bacterium]|nr:DNRLRE domain-containing protein [Planctomycetota bacterium]